MFNRNIEDRFIVYGKGNIVERGYIQLCFMVQHTHTTISYLPPPVKQHTHSHRRIPTIPTSYLEHTHMHTLYLWKDFDRKRRYCIKGNDLWFECDLLECDWLLKVDKMLDPSGLTDDELRAALHRRGVNAGPWITGEMMSLCWSTYQCSIWFLTGTKGL